MSTVAVPKQVSRMPVVIDDELRIPAWVVDLLSFRRWARSDEFPERGQFSYLAGELWVDVSMEQLFWHNRVKNQYTIVVGGMVEVERKGYFFSDNVLLSNVPAELSTEPDALYVSFESLRETRARMIQGAEGGFVEIEGSPDMVLEILSRSSVHKDTAVLRELYWRAGIPEYWLVDVRGRTQRFDILRRGSKGYVAVRRHGGWLKSEVFERAFRLTQQVDPLGNPQYTLAVKE